MKNHQLWISAGLVTLGMTLLNTGVEAQNAHAKIMIQQPVTTEVNDTKTSTEGLPSIVEILPICLINGRIVMQTPEQRGLIKVQDFGPGGSINCYFNPGGVQRTVNWGRVKTGQLQFGGAISINDTVTNVNLWQYDPTQQCRKMLLIQQADGEASGVTVTLSEYKGRVNTIKEKYTAATFSDLRLVYGKDLQNLLNPFLADSPLRGLIDANPAVARQVLSATQLAPANAETLNLIKGILKELDSDEFKIREQASTKLKALSSSARETLMAMDLTTYSAEVRVRVEEIRPTKAGLTPEVIASLRQNRFFLLDAMLLPDQSLAESAAAEFSKLVGKPITLATAPERPQQIEALRKEWLKQPTTQPTQEIFQEGDKQPEPIHNGGFRGGVQIKPRGNVIVD
ncbi:MAG: hypothetical protein WCJ97_01165 [Phycisphaerae bacterium]